MERICAPAEQFFGFVQSFIGAGSQIRSFLTLGRYGKQDSTEKTVIREDRQLRCTENDPVRSKELDSSTDKTGTKNPINAKYRNFQRLELLRK